MTRYYTETEIFARIEDLTPPKLGAWIDLELIRPVFSERGHLFREVDIARITLMCRLDNDYALDDEGLSLVMDLLDQAHKLRAEMDSLMRALAKEPRDLRLRLRQQIDSPQQPDDHYRH